jgi:hypothetical protein
MLNGKPYAASKTAYELRTKLFREHWGLTERDSMDFLKGENWADMLQIMKVEQI